MRDIDWSKAPEGATHWVGFMREEPMNPWEKHTDGQRCIWIGQNGEWVEASMYSLKSYDVVIERPAQWKGPQDGLPPVGYTQDDCALVHLDESDKFEVVAHRHGYAIVVFGPDEDGGMVMSTAARESEFRPLKTERDKAADDFLAITGVHHSWHYTLGLIHDAGYRKQMSREDAEKILCSIASDRNNGDLRFSVRQLILNELGFKD